jgi:UDP-N-acetyl-2-amino-2-deoxyglucuronate dehydrogenase
VDYVSVCSPNHLHDAHARLALRVGADAICEKPLVLNPWNLDALRELEGELEGRVYTVLQLRLHPDLMALRDRLRADGSQRRRVRLTYVTSRGTWYRYSWKGDPVKSGGVVTNIGIHFFDLLLWLFGPAERSEVHLFEAERMAGSIVLKNADVQWFLSVDQRDLPAPMRGVQPTYRCIEIDGAEVEFSEGFNDLHTRVYQETLAGRGFGIEDARPSIELVHSVRTQSAVRPSFDPHPLVEASGRAPA